jgi:hypothetical protein
MKIKLCFPALVICLFCAGDLLYAQSAVYTSSSAAVLAANRRTAVRCLQLARQYADDKQWEAADSQASLGLAYDDAVADLWYIRALAGTSLGLSKSTVIPFVKTALTDAVWVDYNRDAARLLYADLISDTGNFQEALDCIDAPPMLYSADAECIRVKCYYNLPGKTNGAKARSKIDAARRIYPLDTRFPLLFFRYEYRNDGDTYSAEVLRIADLCTAGLSQTAHPDPELEIYAALFARGETRIRMLKSFNARGLTHPLYAAAALQSGLIDQNAALSYLLKFADTSIDLRVLESFVPLITEESAKKTFADYLTAYGGTLTEDTDGDLISNLRVSYKRGRPDQIVYDGNQDGAPEWTASCDFGVPVSVHSTHGAQDIIYGTWPAVIKSVWLASGTAPSLTLNFAPDALSWTPFLLEPRMIINKTLGTDFFYPVLPAHPVELTKAQLVAAASEYEIPSPERPDAVITVSVLNGVPQTAHYAVNGVQYAQTFFTDGIPVQRMVDQDGDGRFETTEIYERASGLTAADALVSVYGTPETASVVRLKAVQVDTNGDTLPDYTEEYAEDGTKTSSWNNESNGQWDVRYVKHPAVPDGSVSEDAFFHQPWTNEIVMVSSVNGVPVSVKAGDHTLSVTRDSAAGVYWIGQPGSAAAAQKCMETVNQSTVQGVCSIVETGSERVLAVRVGKMIFGEMLPDTAAVHNEK